MATGAQIVAEARKYIGEGSTRFAYAYGLNPLDNWCCVFVWYIFRQCNASKLFYGGKPTAWCPNVYQYCRAHLRQVAVTEAQAGDIVLFDFNHNGTSDHIGIVTGRKSSTQVYTIEGNTTGRTSSCVAAKTRNKSDIHGIFRPAYSDPDVITINRTYEVVNPKGAPMRRGASKRYKTVQIIPYGTKLKGKKLFKKLYVWSDYGKTGWIPIKEGTVIYLHVR